MSEIPRPNSGYVDAPPLHRMLALFGRGVVYAIAFWTVFRVLQITFPSDISSTDSDEKLRQRQTTQMDAYEEQVKRTDQLFEQSEAQQARMRELISKQEEQAKRFDAVLDSWEKQAGLRK